MLPDYPIVEALALTARHALYRARKTSTGEFVVLKRARRDYPPPDDVLQLEFERHVLDRLRGPGVIELLGLELPLPA